MIQKLIGERTTIGMGLSILLGLVLVWFKIPTPTESSHWLIGEFTTFVFTERMLSALVLISLGLFYRDVQTRMKLSQKRGYFQPVLLGLFLIPLSQVSFTQVASVASLTLALLMLFATHRSEKPEASIQRVGIACGVSIILYPSMFWGAVIIMIVAMRLRQRSWRKGVIFVLGLLFPFVLLFTFLLAMNWHDEKASLFVTSMFATSGRPIDLVSWIPALAILIFTLIKPMGDGYSAGLIPIREMELLQTQLIWMFGFILLGISGQIHWPVAFCAAAVPLSALTTISMENASKWWIPDLVVVVLLSAFLLI